MADDGKISTGTRVSRLAWPVSALVIAASVGLFSLQSVAQTAAPAAVVSGRARVTEGDTIRIGDRRIRLWGIDAPESGADCGNEHPSRDSRAALREIVDNQTVSCTVRETRNGRDIAACTARGHDVATTLVERGWARDWPRHSCGAFASAEAQARQHHRGLWAMQCATMWGDRNYSADRCSQPPAAPH